VTEPAVPARPLLDIPFNDWFKAFELEPKEAYRVRQVHTWVFDRRVKTFADMSDLPQSLREKWEGAFRLRTLVLRRREVSAEDGTARLFFETSDRKSFSSVYLPAKGGEGDRSALCLSTQIGCAWGCVFCASGRVALERNLSAAEMVEQVFWAEEAFGRKINSLVFMGMGEPLANFTNLVQALQVIRSPLGLNYGARHVTVSTSGLVPQITMLAAVGSPRQFGHQSARGHRRDAQKAVAQILGVVDQGSCSTRPGATNGPRGAAG
jgi:23S rRNA (adenine2503-C2)-methyltransferase